MWGSAGVGPELLCDGWLYHATSNGDGLHLKAGEYCEYQWTKAAPVEVWLSMQPKNMDAEREEEQRRLRVAIANQALLNKGMRNNAGENNCFLNVCIQGESHSHVLVYNIHLRHIQCVARNMCTH